MTDKFLFTYAVAKRAKEILEEGTHYQTTDSRDRRPIIEAIKDLKTGLVNIEISETKNQDIKEEEDTLDTLYDAVKLPEHEIETKPVFVDEVKRKRKDILEEDDEMEEELASIDKATSLDDEDEEDEEDEEIVDEDAVIVADLEEDFEDEEAEPDFIADIDDEDAEPPEDALKE